MSTGPLHGFVVGVAADRRSGELIELLTRKGAEVVHGATMRTHPLGPEPQLADATRRLIADPPAVTVLTTGIGVRGWFEAAEALDAGESLLDALAAGEIVVRGGKAHGAAITAGLTPGWHAPGATTGEIVVELARRGVRGERVAVQLDGAREARLCADIAALGADVVPVPVYRWTLPDDPAPAHRLAAAVRDRRVDAVVFTARPQIENLCRLAADLGFVDELVAALATDVTPVCVGPVCAAAARGAGFGEPIVPARFRLGSMVHALATEFSSRAVPLRLGGVDVRLQGRGVLVGDGMVRLTDRESDLLHALAGRFGAVLSKEQLLADIWPDGDGDGHVVEVTVARLRRRLGPAGVGVETVYRRGYRLSAA